MTNEEHAREAFAKDTANHVMEIVRDDGVYRHLKFRGPSFAYWFDLVTWPGSLAIKGDMGDYLFSRTEDMFSFFRGKESRIDYRYWAEKCGAADKCGTEEFTHAEYVRCIREAANQWAEDRDDKAEFLKDVQEYLIDGSDDLSQEDAIGNAMEFEWLGDNPFSDFYEWKCKEYTTHFVWCCHAIRWGIQQYDAAKKETPCPSPKTAN